MHTNKLLCSWHRNENLLMVSGDVFAVLEKWGRNELPEKVTPKWLIVFRLVRHFFSILALDLAGFLSMFGLDLVLTTHPQLTGPMPMMLWAALIIEAIIGNYADMGILLGIQVKRRCEPLLLALFFIIIIPQALSP